MLSHKNLPYYAQSVRRQSFSEWRGVFVTEALVRFLFEFMRCGCFYHSRSYPQILLIAYTILPMIPLTA